MPRIFPYLVCLVTRFHIKCFRKLGYVVCPRYTCTWYYRYPFRLLTEIVVVVVARSTSIINNIGIHPRHSWNGTQAIIRRMHTFPKLLLTLLYPPHLQLITVMSLAHRLRPSFHLTSFLIFFLPFFLPFLPTLANKMGLPCAPASSCPQRHY